MARNLPDGSILPSFMGCVNRGSTSPGARGLLRDTQLRMGEVQKAYAPNDPKNQSKVAWEYVVNVNTYRDDQSLTEAPQVYRATVADMFGNLADRRRFTLRAASSEPAPGTSIGNGSIVLLLCPSGDKSQAIIVGAWRSPLELDPRFASKYTDPSETFYEFEFNGVLVTIDKDGAVKLTVPGATQLDGSPGDRDSNNHGSTVALAKDGTITVTDKNGESIVIQPSSKTITVKAGNHTTEVQDTWLLKVPTVRVEAEEVTIKAGKVNLGADGGDINPLDEVVVGSGIDTLTGLPFKLLGDTSSIVKAKK
jgi:phage baseplate assembly protein gpV